MRLASFLCFLAAAVVFLTHGLDNAVVETAWGFFLATLASALYVMD